MAIMGPSGCGKSTLLNIIAGELLPHRGKIQVLSTDLAQLDEAQRRAFRIQNIGFVFQDFPLVPYLSSIENVMLPYRLNSSLSLSKDTIENAKNLLHNLGLNGKEKRRPAQLSQGEQQRVAIARSLIANPKLLLADEPTAGLDPQRSESVMDLLEQIVRERGMTLVVVTHDPLIRSRFEQRLDLKGEEA